MEWGIASVAKGMGGVGEYVGIIWMDGNRIKLKAATAKKSAALEGQLESRDEHHEIASYFLVLLPSPGNDVR